MDDQQVANLNLGQHPVHGELVAVFAQRAGYVVLVVAGGGLFAHHGDVVIGPVDGGAHQVGGAGVHPDILLVDVLLVERPGDQVAVGGQHEPAQLGVDGHVPHPGGDQDLLKGPAHPLADDGDVVGGLLGAVGHPHAAGQVDEGDVDAGLLLQLHGQFEQDGGQSGVVVVGQGVGGQEGVDAELLRPQLLQAAEGVGHLGPGQAVLGVPGVVHHLEALFALPQGEGAAGIVPAGDFFGNITDGFLQKVNVGDVVQIDGGPQLGGQGELLRRGVVGGEHNLIAGEAAALGHHQLGEGGAVHAAALLPEELQDLWVGGGLHGEVLLKAGVPGKGPVQRAGVFPDARLVVQVEGGGVVPNDLLELLQGDEGCFHRCGQLLF